MDDIEKLRILIPHWIEHNTEHAAEFERWAAHELAGHEHISDAARFVEAANQALGLALEKLGGPSDAHHFHEHTH